MLGRACLSAATGNVKVIIRHVSERVNLGVKNSILGLYNFLVAFFIFLTALLVHECCMIGFVL